MKTVKLYYGSSMTPDWEIYETDATLSDLLSFAFDLQKFYHLTDTKTKEEIISDFIKNHHYKFLTLHVIYGTSRSLRHTRQEILRSTAILEQLHRGDCTVIDL